MKKYTLMFLFLSILGIGVFSSCKKEKETKDDKITGKPNDSQGSKEADEGIEDVNDFINNRVGGGSAYKVSAYNLPCGVVRVDSTVDGNGDKTYTMKYGNQTTCGYKKKGGDIAFGLINGTNFSDTGAIYTLTYINYAVESLADGQVVTLNGTLYITNVSGGYTWEVVTDNRTITHRLRGNFQVTHSDNVVRPRNYFQLRTFSSTGGWAGLSLTINGDTTITSMTISETGKTHEGDFDYKTEVIDPFVWANCGSTFAGPYVLKQAYARLNVTIPTVSPAYIEVQGGYFYEYTNASLTPTLVNDCTTNAYKITTVIGPATTTVYQLY